MPLSHTSQATDPAHLRITHRLPFYWRSLRHGRVMPHENDIDPDAIADLWDHCFLVQVRDLTRTDYNYTYLGSSILALYRTGIIDPASGGLASPNAAKLAHHYEDVIRRKCPVLEQDRFTTSTGALIKYRQCLLPLGTGDTVESIFGGMRYKLFPQG